MVKTLIILSCVVALVMAAPQDTSAGELNSTKSPETVVKDAVKCKLPEGLEGECVEYDLCSTGYAPVDYDNIRYTSDPCEAYLKVCCASDKILSHPLAY